MTIKDVTRLRLLNQQIVQHAFDKPGDVVKWFGAMQAQDYLNSLWAIGLRLNNATQSDIEKAISDKTIVRTWPMRGTLHFVAGEDVHWILKLLAPRAMGRAANVYKQAGLDDKTFTKSKKLFANALQGGKQLTRTDLYEVLEQSKISTAGQRGLHIIGKLAHEGLICLAARNNKQQTFALLDEWIPTVRTLTRDEALTELAKKYFASHGPATIQDFGWWSGLPVIEAKKSVEITGSYLQKEMIEGRAYYTAANVLAMKTKSRSIHLLPNFDEYLVAYKDRSAALNPEYNKQVIGAAGNGIFSPVIVLNGKVVATWKRTIKNDAVSVQVNPFLQLREQQQSSINTSIKGYAKFLKMKVSICYTPHATN